MLSKFARPRNVHTGEGRALRGYIDTISGEVDSLAAEVSGIELTPDYSIFTAQDHGLVAWSMDPADATGTQAATSGNLMVMKTKAATVGPISAIRIPRSDSGVTCTLAKAAVFDASGASLGVSGNAASDFASGGDKDLTLTSPTRATVVGEVLYLAFLVVGTGTPTMRTATAAPSLNQGLTASAGYRSAALSGQSDMPSSLTLSGLSASTTRRLLLAV